MKPATNKEIINMIEYVIIPQEMRFVDDCNKKLKELEVHSRSHYSGMVYGYHYGIKIGHQKTIEILQDIIRAMKGKY